MWTANIDSKDLTNGVFLVRVLYTNGVTKFGDAIDMTGGNTDTLNTKIQSRLNTLNANDTLLANVTVGPYTPTTKPNTNLDAFVAAMRHFQSCQRAVTLGLISTGDKIYTDAFSALQGLYDPTFIDSI